LSTQINRLKNIACATETDEHDMMRLKNSVSIALENNASDDVIAEADSLFKRLEVELGDVTLHDVIFLSITYDIRYDYLDSYSYCYILRFVICLLCTCNTKYEYVICIKSNRDN
jgi:hypothetical protein